MRSAGICPAFGPKAREQHQLVKPWLQMEKAMESQGFEEEAFFTLSGGGGANLGAKRVTPRRNPCGKKVISCQVGGFG